jgi:hypothetical protein
MHKNNLKKTVSFDYALDKIKANNSHTFKWYAVKNHTGSLIELGGSNYNGNLQLKADIPLRTPAGRIQIYKLNGFVMYRTSFGHNVNLHPSDGTNMDYDRFYSQAKFYDYRTENFGEDDPFVVTITKKHTSKYDKNPKWWDNYVGETFEVYKKGLCYYLTPKSHQKVARLRGTKPGKSALIDPDCATIPKFTVSKNRKLAGGPYQGTYLGEDFEIEKGQFKKDTYWYPRLEGQLLAPVSKFDEAKKVVKELIEKKVTS